VRPVNLLPARYRPRTGGSGDNKTAYAALGALALLALAVFGYVITANKVNSANAEIAAARQQIEAAESQAVTLQGFGDFAGVKEARLSAVKELATSRLDWERLFRELAHVLPENVWLTGFEAQAGSSSAADAGGELGPKTTLKGCADSHARIADAMIRLRELHVAEDVELTQTTAGEDGDGEAAGGASATGASTDSSCGKYYSFEVAVTMAMPVAGLTPETSKPVPARLGGGG
jgi:Tfp pilus assembly protein PilN